MVCAADMDNVSDSDDDFYTERTALVPSENPVVPSYRPDADPEPANDTPSKRVKVSFTFYISSKIRFPIFINEFRFNRPSQGSFLTFCYEIDLHPHILSPALCI